MSTKEKDRTKQIQDKCQNVLIELLRDEDNKYCVDCDSKGPRWASWNLGVFLCIRCAGIHRNLGVHISKVKSVNLDSWTPEQVVSLQQMGNSRARAVYEANLPDNFRRPQNDSSLESFIRAKYEHKKYIAREWVPPPLPKVNWEKEIDEEIERQKRKKNKYVDSKNKIQIKPLANVEIPQLPKPKSVAPVPIPAPTSSPQNGAKESNVDLLNTTPNDDAFSSFLSGPTPVEKEVPKSSEEENFFNQPAPTEKEKTQLTKDSILALYGQTPSYNPPQPQFQQNFNQFQQTAFAPGNFQYGQQTGYNMFPSQGQQDTSFFQPAQCFGLPQAPVGTQFQSPRPAQGISVPNPFLQPNTSPINLQQQFGNLSLNQSTANIIPNVWP